MKRRNLTLSICMLAILAFSSIGFAAWVITRPSTDYATEGAIIVDAATNGAYELVVPTTAGNIVFGAPADATNDGTQWLVNEDNTEVLSQTIQISVDIADDNTELEDIAINDLKISLAYVSKSTDSEGKPIEVDESASFQACVDANLIVAPKLYYCSAINTETGEKTWTEFASGATLDDAVCFLNGVCELKVEFAWGTEFNSMNPYEYYNGLDYTNALAVEAEENLNLLHENLEGVYYKLTING